MAKKSNTRPAVKSVTPKRAARGKPTVAKAQGKAAKRPRGAGANSTAAEMGSAETYVVLQEPSVGIVAAAEVKGRGTPCASFADARDLALDLLLECIESCEEHLTLLKRASSYAQYVEWRAAR